MPKDPHLNYHRLRFPDDIEPEDRAELRLDDLRFAHDVWLRGEGKPAVIVIHELPGLARETFILADRLFDAGFSVALPQLFGKLYDGSGRSSGRAAAWQGLRLMCVRREINIFARNRSSPIVNWLKGLARWLHLECGGPGVGVIGMCLTGNFALSMVAEESVLAPVACQPSLPLPLGAIFKRIGPRDAAALHMSAEEVAAVRTRLSPERPGLCYRFQDDWRSPAARFEAFGAAFNEPEEAPRVKLTPLRMDGYPDDAHSVLTYAYRDSPHCPTRNAFDEIVENFERQLKPAG